MYAVLSTRGLYRRRLLHSCTCRCGRRRQSRWRTSTSSPAARRHRFADATSYRSETAFCQGTRRRAHASVREWLKDDWLRNKGKAYHAMEKGRGRHISSSGSTRPENHWIKVDPAARDAVRRREAVRLRDALRSDAAEWSEERIRDAIDGIQVVFVGPTGKQEGLERSALWLNDLRLRPAVVINHLLLRHGLLGSDASQGGASLPDTSVLRRIVRVARERREWLVADGAVRIEDDSVERLTALLTRSRSERAPPPRAAQCTRSSTWARTRCRSRPPPRCWCRHSRTSRSTHRPRWTARGSTRHLQSPFGGLPVLLCGDNYQKPPPKSTPWFQTLVQDSLKVRDGDTAEGQGGCRSAIAAGLAVLRLA